MQMKMSAFPLPVAGFPNITTTQLLMSAAGGLNFPPPSPSNPTSPKELPNVSAATMAGLVSVARVPSMPNELSIATGHHPSGAYLPPQLANMHPSMLDPRVLYSALNGGYDIKENADAIWRQIAAQAQQAASAGVLSYDAHAAAMAAASYSYPSYPSMDLNGARRKNATRETTSTLKAWLYEHRKNPYPTKGEKIMLAILTKMTLTQVSTWFANARRRLKKENKMTWSPRNRTDDGSSVDDEDKPDNEDGVIEEDDVSIDLSDFETENNSPQKQSGSIPPSSIPSAPTATVTPQSSVSNDRAASVGNSKPRIWSIADVAANKPLSSSSHSLANHQSPSVRHRPYPIPNSTAFRPWFDNSYRQLAGHPAVAAVLSNPLLGGSRSTTTPSLRVPHLSSTSSSISHPVRSPSSSSSSPSDSTDRTITSEPVLPTRRQVRDGSSPPQPKVSKHDQEH